MKLGHMKSHDFHVMLTQILPVAIRNLMDKDIRNTVIELCDFFNQLRQKVVDPEELDHMQDDIARILSNLEMFFPLSFFDVMVHLTMHLVDEKKVLWSYVSLQHVSLRAVHGNTEALLSKPKPYRGKHPTRLYRGGGG